MTSKQKMQLIDLVDYTIIPAISEDLGIWDKDGVNEALSFLVKLINNEKIQLLVTKIFRIFRYINN